MTDPSGVAAARAARWGPAFLWTAFMLWPAPLWGAFTGVPLGPIGIAALCALWLNWTIRPTSLGWRIPAALLIIKAAAGVVSPAPGFVAEYFANDRWTPPHERSVEFRQASFTRVDREIAFGPAARNDLPLFFLNDIGRFNFYQPNEPDRRFLSYSIRWAGELLIESDDDAPTLLFIEGRGVSARLSVDRFPVASVEPASTMATGGVRLRKGWRHIDIAVAAPYGADRSVSAGSVDAGGRRHPLGRGVFVQRYGAWRLRVARIVGLAAQVVDAGVLAWLLGGTLVALIGHATSSPRRLWPLLAAAAVLEALFFARPWSGRMMLLGGGGDPMTYEFQARDILLNGPLMNGGRPFGDGEAFYYQPLYAYVLAALHWLSGEGFLGIVFAQRLFLWVTVALVWRMTASAFGEDTGRVGLLVAFIFCVLKLAHWSDVLLTEAIFVPLLCAWVLSLMRVAQRVSLQRIAGAGVFGGGAALARSTAVLAWPLVLRLVAVGQRGRRRVTAPLLLTLVMIATISVATARNWAVSGRFVPVTTSFSINVYLGNEPPKGAVVHGVAEHRGYRWFAREDTTRLVIEFARHSPMLFVRGLWKKLLYSLGFFGALVAGASWVPTLVFTWIAAAAGIVLAYRRHVESFAYMPLAVALSQLAAVVLIFPHIYVDRLILPLYVLLLPYCALTLRTALGLRNLERVIEASRSQASTRGAAR